MKPAKWRISAQPVWKLWIWMLGGEILPVFLRTSVNVGKLSIIVAVLYMKCHFIPINKNIIEFSHSLDPTETFRNHWFHHLADWAMSENRVTSPTVKRYFIFFMIRLGTRWGLLKGANANRRSHPALWCISIQISWKHTFKCKNSAGKCILSADHF